MRSATRLGRPVLGRSYDTHAGILSLVYEGMGAKLVFDLGHSELSGGHPFQGGCKIGGPDAPG